MMLGGIVLLALSRLSGEANPLPFIPLRAGVALLYLVVAVAPGYFVAGEELSARTLLASILIVLSVFLILRVGAATVKK
jgi:drug/metabolite transporter (DMT)-like permease